VETAAVFAAGFGIARRQYHHPPAPAPIRTAVHVIRSRFPRMFIPDSPGFPGVRRGRRRTSPLLLETARLHFIAHALRDFLIHFHSCVFDVTLRSQRAAMNEYRLGDDVDDYCIKCKRLTNHSIISIVDGAPAKVRCRTCYHEQTFRKGEIPPSKKDLKKAELFNTVLSTIATGATPEAEAGKKQKQKKSRG
jgi:hypothetical protein